MNLLDRYDALLQKKVIDHVDCKSCGKSYDAERKDPRRGPTCCGECGCIDHRLVKVTTLR